MAEQEKLKILITTDLYTTNTNGVVPVNRICLMN